MSKKTFLVTGTGGNIGFQVATILARDYDYEVWGFDLKHPPYRREVLESAGVRLYEGDFVNEVWGDLPTNPDYVLHYAANTVPKSWDLARSINAIGAANLLAHCKDTKGFLYISTAAVYKRRGLDPDNHDLVYRIRESDEPYVADETAELSSEQTGILAHYATSKIAGEGAIAALAHYLKVPAIICRLDAPYGNDSMCVPLLHLKAIMDDQPVIMPKGYPFGLHCIHVEDLAAFAEPLCKAARWDNVPTVNLCGDDMPTAAEYIPLFEELTGKKANIIETHAAQMSSGALDTTLRKSITGPCKWNWRDGFTAVAEEWIPILREGDMDLINYRLCLGEKPDFNNADDNKFHD